jgi:hypothetical protein
MDRPAIASASRLAIRVRKSDREFDVAGKKRANRIKWRAEVEKGNYPAAESYLTLLYDQTRVTKIISRLRSAGITRFKAKDIFRASGLSLLGVSNYHVEKDRNRIRDGIKLSPLLLVRDEKTGRVVVADGYHRLCAVYGFDEDAWIDCKII